MRYAVKIRGEVTKTITVDAECEKDAIELAPGEFSVHSDGEPEDYDEVLVSVQTLDEPAASRKGEDGAS